MIRIWYYWHVRYRKKNNCKGYNHLILKTTINIRWALSSISTESEFFVSKTNFSGEKIVKKLISLFSCFWQSNHTWSKLQKMSAQLPVTKSIWLVSLEADRGRKFNGCEKMVSLRAKIRPKIRQIITATKSIWIVSGVVWGRPTDFFFYLHCMYIFFLSNHNL